jgi:hypothetical protein
MFVSDSCILEPMYAYAVCIISDMFSMLIPFKASSSQYSVLSDNSSMSLSVLRKTRGGGAKERRNTIL